MKKQVWENKSNSQLCVTIPKDSGIKPGEIVSIEKQKIKKIVYTSVAADMFHYGHLQFLEKANELGDYHICGVFTENAMKEYGKKPVADFHERKAIISSLRCVDMVIPQNTLNPKENLEKIKDMFKNSEIIIARGDNKKEIPGEEFIKKLKFKIIKIPYYKKLSDKNIDINLKSSKEI